jgi:hypothetical protein
MSSFLIIILAIILLALIILNNIKIVSTENVSASNCTQTTFGCCPNGVDSKINYYGTNCPMFNPGPGYQPGPGPPGPGPPGPGPPGPGPMPPKPIGGCVGTRFGCCANSQTPKINVQGSNCVLNQ